ncbi:MAG: Uncharacterised protein [Halieaceae bacterium]|nr:MAG: Uncharacterised protein [Halieaceae bacterium]
MTRHKQSATDRQAMYMLKPNWIHEFSKAYTIRDEPLYYH